MQVNPILELCETIVASSDSDYDILSEELDELVALCEVQLRERIIEEMAEFNPDVWED